MLWIFLALLGALTNAAYFIIVKKYIRALDPKSLQELDLRLAGACCFCHLLCGVFLPSGRIFLWQLPLHRFSISLA